MMETDLIESIFRWVHIVAGVLWIGLLYFFNWVNAPFAPTMDADSKKKVVPELLPRALFWFRWGAAYTWFSGVILLALIYYHGQLVSEDASGFSSMVWVMLAITFLGVFAYDLIMKSVKDLKVQFIVGWVISSGLIYWWMLDETISYRGAAIHLGAMFGTAMAFNVWFRIWPAQQKIITAIKNGEAPDAALVGLAGLRSKHNTYMSIPLIFLMMSRHATWASSYPWAIALIILVGWIGCSHLYKLSQKVPGF